MLPKCLPFSRRRGHHTKQISVDHLCDLWSKNELHLLWNQVTAMANATSRPHDTRVDDTQRLIQSAVSLARVGLYGKTCRVLQSSGIAPDDNNIWHLLQAKHPSCPLPSAPDIPSRSALMPVLTFYPYEDLFPRELLLVPQDYEFNIFWMLFASPYQHQYAHL